MAQVAAAEEAAEAEAEQRRLREAAEVAARTAARLAALSEFDRRPRPGRNQPCWCGSGEKYKKCHLAADDGRRFSLESAAPSS